MKIIGKRGVGRNFSDADTLRLMRLLEGKRYTDVMRLARELLARNGQHVVALRALTFSLLILGQYEEVISIASQALKDMPSDGEIHNNRAIALAMLMHWDEAIEDFKAALRYAPADYEIYKNLGSAYTRLHRWDDAATALLKAIELHPDDYVDAVALLALVLMNANRFDESAVCSRALHEKFPDKPELLFFLVGVELCRCDWNGLGEQVERLREMWKGFRQPVANPWSASWMWCFSGMDHASIGREFAKDVIASDLLKVSSDLRLSWREGARRLRIGYLSADFRNHPVAFAVAELIERHHRDRVEVFAYSTGEDDHGPQRQRLVNAFDHFSDLTRLSVHATAERIRADRIDILVDLTGWTTGERVESLAIRCAPIQVNWLGYPGTLGHPKLADYIIGDPVITPLGDQEIYTETIMQMPHSYMPTDTTRKISDAPLRSSQGLPEKAFVLCSFNNMYKFNPPLFDLWCGLLREMPDAVLWLPRHNDAVASNLRKEFTLRGIDGSRLILADRVDSSADHLGRLQLADLALDTFPYNSHSTGVDMLWAGVPLVCKRGDTFAGRVGASLLSAVGLPDLIAEDDADYVRLVLDLHRDRARLAKVREHLQMARRTSPLFDMDKFAHDLENLYFEMARRAIDADEAPVEAVLAAPGHSGPAPVS